LTLTDKKETKSFKKLPDTVKNIEIRPRELIKIEELIDPINEKSDYDEYMRAPEHSKKQGYKYLLVLYLSKGLYREQLRRFVKKWNSIYTDMKTSYASVMRARKIAADEGKAALLGKYGLNTGGKYKLNEDLYSRFLQIYLSPEAPKFTDAVNKLKNEVLTENPDFPNFPSLAVFIRHVRKDFTENEINNFRNVKVIKQDKKEESIDIMFKEVAELFLKGSYLKKIKPSTAQSYVGYVKNYLIPFFGDYNLSEINGKIIAKFKEARLDEGLSMSNIESYIGALRIIVKIYYPGNALTDTYGIISDKNYYKDMRILDKTKIKQLLETAKDFFPDFYPVVLTALTTGVTRSELLALTVDCIGFEKQVIKVEKSVYKGQIVKHRNKYQTRNVSTPQELFKVLKNNIKVSDEFVFPNTDGKIQDPDNMIKRRFNPLIAKAGIKPVRFIDLRDTYAALLIQQNFPLTYIQQQLGHSSVNVTAERYKSLIPDVKVEELF
jgi:integrase